MPDYSVAPGPDARRDRRPPVAEAVDEAEEGVGSAEPLKAALARLGRAVARRGY